MSTPNSSCPSGRRLPPRVGRQTFPHRARQRIRRGAGAPVTLDVLADDEAPAYLADAAPGAATGPDPDATARIVRHCGGLPLALSRAAEHMRQTPGWTLTDHADRLDARRPDPVVEAAFDLSYRALPPDRRRMLRLLALHPEAASKLARRLAVFFAVLVTSLVATQSPALATDHSFGARHAHGGGTGALAVKIRGGITWHNRSVTLTAVEMWVKGGECAEIQFESFQGNVYLKAIYQERSICNYGSGKWYGWGNIKIDADHISGGITWMRITAYDGTHNGSTSDEVYR